MTEGCENDIYISDSGGEILIQKVKFGDPFPVANCFTKFNHSIKTETSKQNGLLTYATLLFLLRTIFLPNNVLIQSTLPYLKKANNGSAELIDDRLYARLISI